MIITVSKEAISFNNINGWGGARSKKPIRIKAGPNATNETFANLVEILDVNGKVVAAVVASKDGSVIANSGAHVVVFTEYDVRVRG